MGTLFFFCAVIGGTIFLFQFVLLLVGFGLEGADIDGDVPEGMDGDVDFDGDVGDIDHETGMIDHGSTWLFSVISIRTVVAAVTMFGLVGMASVSAMGTGMWSSIYAIVLAVIGGACALFGVHFLMRTLFKMGSDGKVRVRNAVGQTATVYVPVPAGGQTHGKVQIRLQGRLVELAAITDGREDLPTGSKVRVVGVVGGSTVKVERLTTKAKTEEPVNT